jgi:hypothetical protein
MQGETQRGREGKCPRVWNRGATEVHTRRRGRNGGALSITTNGWPPSAWPTKDLSPNATERKRSRFRCGNGLRAPRGTRRFRGPRRPRRWRCFRQKCFYTGASMRNFPLSDMKRPFLPRCKMHPPIDADRAWKTEEVVLQSPTPDTPTEASKLKREPEYFIDMEESDPLLLYRDIVMISEKKTRLSTRYWTTGIPLCAALPGDLSF